MLSIGGFNHDLHFVFTVHQDETFDVEIPLMQIPCRS